MSPTRAFAINFAGGAGGGNAFTIIQPDTGTSPTAGSPTSTLTITSANANLTVSGDSGTNTITLTAATQGAPRNLLINSGFDFWQRYGASPTQTVANTVSTYIPDRWYVKNTLGTNGVITGSQVAGVTNGSKWGCSVKITTAPTVGQTNGCEVYQTLENYDSLVLYGQTASCGALVKALGNVNQVGIQFFYKTTEAKVDTAIGSETLVTVNTSTFVSVNALAQAVGTTQTTSGVVGIRIRITAVASGNTYDLNNGFVVEQAQVCLGSTLPTWQRAGQTKGAEKLLCQRFYTKSYDEAVAPGTASNFNGLVFTNGGVATSASHAVNSFFKVSMRIAPTATCYDLAGTSGKYSLFDASGNSSSGFTPSGFVAGENSVYLVANAITSTGIGSHYTADAEI